MGVRIDTVDAFQGGEAKYAVDSMVRSNETGDIGFCSSPQRLNVLLKGHSSDPRCRQLEHAAEQEADEGGKKAPCMHRCFVSTWMQPKHSLERSASFPAHSRFSSL